jgi:hypothetical protein
MGCCGGCDSGTGCDGSCTGCAPPWPAAAVAGCDGVGCAAPWPYPVPVPFPMAVPTMPNRGLAPSPGTGAIDLATLASLAPVGQQFTGAVRSLSEWWQANRAKVLSPAQVAVRLQAPGSRLQAESPVPSAAAMCPSRTCILHELGALDDATGQRNGGISVPDGAQIEVLGRATGMIRSGGVPSGPQEWLHVRATGSDGAVIEGWMVPAQVRSASGPTIMTTLRNFASAATAGQAHYRRA